MQDKYDNKYKQLVEYALIAMKNAYAPYSGLKVGAAVLTDRGNIFTGVNVENASFGATNCAERTAIFKAVSEGETGIIMVAVASDMDDIIYPCGICRQVLAEFCKEDAAVICANKKGEYMAYTLKDLLPCAFHEFKI